MRPSIHQITIELVLMTQEGEEPLNYSLEDMVKTGHLIQVTAKRYRIMDEEPEPEPEPEMTNDEHHRLAMHGLDLGATEPEPEPERLPEGGTCTDCGAYRPRVDGTNHADGWACSDCTHDRRVKRAKRTEPEMSPQQPENFSIGAYRASVVRGPHKHDPTQWYWRIRYSIDGVKGGGQFSMWATEQGIAKATYEWIRRRTAGRECPECGGCGYCLAAVGWPAGATGKGLPSCTHCEGYGIDPKQIQRVRKKLKKKRTKRNRKRMNCDGQLETRYISPTYIAMAKSLNAGRRSKHQGKPCVWLTDDQKEVVSDLIRQHNEAVAEKRDGRLELVRGGE